MDYTTTTPRNLSLETLLEEATLKACKDGVPDDVTYWNEVGAQWKRQQGLAQSTELPRDQGVALERANAYPDGTTLTLRKQGEAGAGEALVDLTETKRRAMDLRKDRYIDYKKAEQAFHARHIYFIRSLTGRPKQIVDGIETDPERYREYRRRTSWQKTNYVWRLIVTEVRSTWALEEQKGRFNRTMQKARQSNADYIRYLEEMRRTLARQGHVVTPRELAHKILDTLNPTNRLHATYFDFDPETTTLRQVKDFLTKVDRRERERMKITLPNGVQRGGARGRRNRFGRGSRPGGRDRATGRGGPEPKIVRRMTAGQFRQGKRRMEEAVAKLKLTPRKCKATRFAGAIAGELEEIVQIGLAPKQRGRQIPTVAYVKPGLSEDFGDAILGLPAMIALEMTLSVTPREFVLKYRTQKVKQTVKHGTNAATIAATRTQYPPHWIKETQAESGRTVHPSREDWEKRLTHLEGPTKKKVWDLLDEFKEQFWVSGYLPPIRNCRYSIAYEGPPFREPLIPLTGEDIEYVNDYFDDQIKQGLVVEVRKDTHRLPYVSNMFLKYEEDGKKRPCINYRKLNANTVKTEMPIPSKERLIATFAGADWYITTDCKAAYNQLIIEESSRPYLTVVFPGRNGRRRYIMPTRANFGSSNMPGEYQRISGDLFEDKDVGVYLDDITIKGYDGREDEALAKFRRVLETCRDHGITLSFKKTELMKKEVNFLGEVLDKRGHRPNPRRIKALQEFPLPTTRKRLRAFLGLYNFLAPLKRHAVSKAIAELSELTSNKVPYNVNKVRRPFETAKKDLATWLLLTPFSPGSMSYVMTDSSANGMGGAIFQLHQGELQAVAVCSKKWPTRKRELPAHTKEGLALITTTKRFEDMLRNTRVTFLTDSANTVDLLTNTEWDLVPSLWLRWRRYLREACRAEVLHIPGPLNLAADILSRQSFILAIDAPAEEVFYSPLLRNIHDEQRNDPYVREKQNELGKAGPQTAKAGKIPEAYFFMEHGLLKRKHHRHGTQIVIPKSMVKKIMYLEHDTVLKGHPGRDVMLLAAKQKFFWPTMNTDIAEYVASCLGCQMAKALMTKKFASHASRQVSELFAVFSVDLCDMSHVSQRYKYILVVMDDFSSFVILNNLRDKRATTVLNALWGIFTIFGPPQALLSDRGAEFVNNLAKRFTEQAGIHHVVTYAYHAQGNGRNERSHRVINNTLRILAQDHPTQWHKYTQGIQYMMNTRPNVDTGISPYEIIFGRKPRTLWNVTPYLEYDHGQMTKLRESIEEMVRQNRQQRIQRATRPERQPLEKGQLVKLVKPFPRRPKYRHPAMGPYRVVKRLATSGYLVEHTRTRKQREVPSYWLQPLKLREEDGESVEQPEGTAKQAPQPTAENRPEAEPSQPSESEEEEVEAEVTEDPERNTKRRRLLREIAPHNQVPEGPNELAGKIGIGTMIAAKQDNRARLGEVRSELDEDWEVHWFGTTSSRSRPRRFWKFYPGWTDPKTGQTRYSNTAVGTGQPATGQVRKEDVIVAFHRLTVKATAPGAALRKLERYTLR